MLKGLDLPKVDTGGFKFGGLGNYSPGPDNWRGWLEQKFSRYVNRGFAEHHEEYWDWLWEIEQDSDPDPFVGIWSRGGGKSSSVELGCGALALRGKRRYMLYVRDTQERADDSVGNIATLFEEAGVGRKLNKYGLSKGWKRNRIRTAENGTIDALGLDVAGRGVKLEEMRPDVIIFDDIDSRHDTQAATAKKIATITNSLLPAGTDNVAIIFIQNLIIPDGIASQLADGRADFLSGRIVSGPHPAIENLKVVESEWPDGRQRHVIDGEPTWKGQDLKACQRLLDRIGLDSFMREAQHDVSAPAGSLVYELYAAALKRGDRLVPNREAAQFLGIDPGFSQRCSMLAVQERADRTEMWREWSFVRCDDDHIARIAAAHCLEWGVTAVLHDAESPELGAAIHQHRAALGDPYADQVFSIPFNKYKRLAIKATRWLLRSNAAAWGARTTELHEPVGAGYRVTEVPGVFRREVKSYKLVPGKDDEAEKVEDHGPDAWHSYVSRWIPQYLSEVEQYEQENE